MNRHKLLRHCILGMIDFEDHFDQVDSKNVRWICDRLAWHKILPLAAALNDHQKPKHPELLDVFMRVILETTLRESQYQKQVIHLFKTLQDESIHFIPYKGPFWNQGIYPEYTWRHIGDIDLLLTKEDSRKASALLQRGGFVPDIVKGSEAEDFEKRGELTLFPGPASSHKFPVQLHWTLLPSHRFVSIGFILPEDFSRESFDAQWKGISFRVPSPEVQLLYYILHATCQHQFNRFVHIMTMVHFIKKRKELDWDALYALAKKRETLTPLYYGLRFINAFSPLPEGGLSLLRKISPSFRARLGSVFLRPGATLMFNPRRGKLRRKIFRFAMSI